MFYFKVFLQSVPALISFLLEFTDGDPNPNKKKNKIAPIAITLICLIVGYVINMTISLTKENDAQKASMVSNSKQIKSLEATITELRRGRDDVTSLNTRLTHDLSSSRAELASCESRATAGYSSGNQTPSIANNAIEEPEPKEPEPYKVPSEILAILGANL